MTSRRSNLLFSAGCTLVLAGYLMVWLPHKTAGLSFIGIEIGEWVKFLPPVQAGQITPGRIMFYLPPVVLGAIMALSTSGWPNRRWQTWLMRGLAIMVSLLAFPSIDAIRFEPPSEWLMRLLLIGFVIAIALVTGITGRFDQRIIWSMIALLALSGLLLPTWAFIAVRPAIAELFREPVRIGSGVWLNAAGFLLILGPAMVHLRFLPAKKLTTTSLI